jgi:protein gp37
MSGRDATPAHPMWFRGVRDQCDAAGVPFLFKQWGAWSSDALLFTDAHTGACPPPCERVGKKRAGRLLDGREHNGMPQVRA